MKNDFYFSESMFNSILKKELDELCNFRMLVCEVKIDGEWRLFTEQIATGYEPVMKRQDVILLGSAYESETRYTPLEEWVEKVAKINVN